MRAFQLPNTFIGIPADTYGVNLLITHITQGWLAPTLGYQTYNAFGVELKWYYNPRHFTH